MMRPRLVRRARDFAVAGEGAARAEITELLRQAGLMKRPSLLRRALPPMGVVAALSMIGGVALWLLIPEVRADREEARAHDGVAGPLPDLKFDRQGAQPRDQDGAPHAAS
jgi:hypothetical protein